MTVWIPVLCPHCHSDDIVKYGKSAEGKQRFKCRNPECPAATFILDNSHPGRSRAVKAKIVEMSLNGSGIRDIARVLHVSTNTVLKTLRNKKPQLKQVNPKLVKQLHPEQIEMDLSSIDDSEDSDDSDDSNTDPDTNESELDELWSYVGSKLNPRWLWHAIDHKSGQTLAYIFGRRKDQVFLKLKRLLKPFGIKRFYTDDLGAYHRHIPPEQLITGKQYTHKIEEKHTNLRTRIKRLARKTICFSKSIELHDIVIGLFINRYEFGLRV